MISAMLGILKARMCFVPLETTLPESRLSSMIGQVGMRYAITDQELSSYEGFGYRGWLYMVGH